MSELLTFEEAAASLDATITAAAIRFAIAKKLLRGRKIGKRYYTTPAALLELAECRDIESQRASISAPASKTGSYATATMTFGPDIAASAADALLRRRSLNTSRRA